MGNKIKDSQSVAFNKLVRKDIPDILKDATYLVKDRYSIKFESFPFDMENPKNVNGTVFNTVKTNCIIEDLRTGESVDFIIDLLNLPLYQDLGFCIKGNNMQMLDSYDRTAGWTFSKKMKNNQMLIRATLLPMSESARAINFVYDGTNVSVFRRSKKDVDETDDVTKVDIATFLQAISDYSKEDLIQIFGFDNPYVISAFTRNNMAALKNFNLNNRNDCIEATSIAFNGKKRAKIMTNVIDKQRFLKRSFFNKKYLYLGDGNANRLLNTQSFRNRCINKVLAEDIVVNGEIITTGTTLSEAILSDIDNSPIDTLKVSYNGKIYNLKKFSHFTFRVLGCTLAETVTIGDTTIKQGTLLTNEHLDILNNSELTSLKVLINKKDSIYTTINRRLTADSLVMEDILTAVSILFDNINGFDTYDQEYELSNRIVIPWDKRVCNIIETHLNRICVYLERQLESMQDDVFIIDAISDFNIDKLGDRFNRYDIDSFINLISDTKVKTGQMSDMNNIMAHLEKDNKVTADISSQSVTDDLVRVQDTQVGRLDPIDAPESSKIGIVHYKTILTETDSDGQLLVPYLPVKDGVVLSEEPVYLTAVQEQGKYIAEWNETFTNDDGSPKMRVLARHDGDVVTVDRSAITYKEFSQLSTMSPARSCIPFQNHSNAKRLLMSCNHQKQAVPTVRQQRPRVNTGCESILGVGVYKASDILENYYDSICDYHTGLREYKDVILGSNIELLYITEDVGFRTLHFSVLAAKRLKDTLDNFNFSDETTLKFPYNQKNPDKGIFSYRINPKADRIYAPTDVVAYNNGYSLDKFDRFERVDYGALKYNSNDFDSGMALGNNLTVAFKTFESSTIDDAVTISSDLVYDDTLTSIYMFEIEETLRTSKTMNEYFGIPSSGNKYVEYMNSNGLPKLGTILKPGDPVISVITQSKGRSHVRSIRLESYMEGQVVYADILTDGKDKYAKVILALRANIEAGDKLSGRYGNKGVVAKIKPAEEMPYNPETGEKVDIILNPLGIPSRMNISQLLELVLGEAMKLTNQIAIVSPFYKDDFKMVKDVANEYNVHPVMLCDGRTGRMFERPVNVGVMYMYKLVHMVKKKVHSIGMDVLVDPVFYQPRRGQKNDGGQSFGEMELWCLSAIGANKVLQDLYSLQSDDLDAKSAYKAAVTQDPENVSVEGQNNNDIAMQVLLRSMCIELETNEDTQEYEFKPLTDSMIRSLSATPVPSDKALHATGIFGNTYSSAEKMSSRELWGWIDLHTEIICPIWFFKGELNKLILYYSNGETVNNISQQKMLSIVEGKTYLYADPTKTLGILRLYEESDIKELTSDIRDCLITGMSAMIYIFRNYNVETTLHHYESKWLPSVNSKDSKQLKDGDLKVLQTYNLVKTFIEKDCRLEDYVISSYPVMPQNFRPQMEHTNIHKVSDFDWHYSQIFAAVRAINTSGESTTTQLGVFNAIKRFIGIRADESKTGSQYQNLLLWFTGKGSTNKNHGKIRESLQKKRTVCSGRSVIIPMSDVTMKPTQLGVPYIMVANMYIDSIVAYLRDVLHVKNDVSIGTWKKLVSYVASGNISKFMKLISKHFTGLYNGNASVAFDMINDHIHRFIEGDSALGLDPQVVIAGRQPSLHQFSIRAFNIKIVTSKAIQIHPLSCKGYNADFDGDTMWICAILTKDAQNEAMEKMSPKYNFINPKNGNIILEHSQDIVLGCYCATMLKNNVINYKEAYGADEEFLSNIQYYSSITELKTDVYNGIVHAYDFVCMNYYGNKYLSTAGRILFNAMFTDGLTDKPFTNPLGLPVVKPELYKELKYDGIITAGGGMGDTKYYKVPDICMDLFTELGSECIHTYQDILEFGFFFSDRFSVTLSIEDLDMDTNKSQLIKVADNIKAQIETDFQNGLISPEDKKNAVIKLYKGTNDEVKKDLIASMPRNNNLFIIFDSGARGNAGQIMQTSGAIGILQKTKTEDLETSITSNYTEGISSFDMHLTTYSGRTGVASTQNETSHAGHATRQAVYTAAGLEIVEKDCGKDNWWYDITWKDHRPELDVFHPTEDWFMSNIVGLSPADADTMALFEDYLEDGYISEDAYEYLAEQGFHRIALQEDEDGTGYVAYEASMTDGDLSPMGHRIVDEESLTTFKYLSNSGIFNNKCAGIVQDTHIKRITVDIGRFEFRYSIDKLSSSLLLNREARNLPYLKEVVTSYDSELAELYGDNYEEHINVITEDTLEYVSQKGIDRIEARVLLDCESQHGICAHCFGLKFTNLKLPRVHENVGIESAQSIGEPAAQLTMSLFHKGGSAGESVANGVSIIAAMLKGNLPKKSRRALTINNTGYVKIDRLDDTVSLQLEPVAVDGEEPTFNHLINTKVKAAALTVIDGQLVHAGDQVTDGFISPDSIVTIDGDNPEELLRRKQMVWLQLYFDTFTSNNIFIFPRHFEIFARLQNFSVTVTHSTNPNFRVGAKYPFSLVAASEGVSYVMKTSKQEEVISNTSGNLALLSFEDVSAKVCSFVVGCKTASHNDSNSTIGRIGIGANVRSKEIKKMRKPIAINNRLTATNNNDDGSLVKEIVISKSLDDLKDMSMANIMDSFGSFDDLDFGMDDLGTMDIFNQTEAKNTNSPEHVDTISDMDIFGNTENISMDDSEFNLPEDSLDDINLDSLDYFDSIDSGKGDEDVNSWMDGVDETPLANDLFAGLDIDDILDEPVIDNNEGLVDNLDSIDLSSLELF